MVLLILLGGCNWVRLLEFRNQLKHLSEYAHWEGRPWGRTLVFSEPLLRLSDLQSLNLSPAHIGRGLYAIHYRYRIEDTESQGSADMLFVLKDGRLGEIAFPAVLIEMMGEKGIEAFLRMAGGADADRRDLEKVQVLRAVFGPTTPHVDDRLLRIIFVPQDDVNPVLKLELEEVSKPGIYSRLSLIAGPQRKPAGGAAVR